MRKPKSLLFQRIALECEEIGNCWIWAGRMSGDKNPVPLIRVDGKSVSVRRVVLAEKGVAMARCQPSRATCGNPLCVAPRHAVASSRSEINKAAWKAGRFQPLSRSAKISAYQRSKSKIGSMEVARAIRANVENETRSAQARRHGVTLRVISMIHAHEIWKETEANPWVLLISANDALRRRA